MLARIRQHIFAVDTQGGNRMRESCTYGSVRGARGNSRPYRDRRTFITLLGGAAAWPLAARAQQPKKIPRLCFLTFDPGTFQSRSARFEPFFNRLKELGYVDGKTITIDYLSAEGRNDRFAEIAAECLRFKADIIAVTTTPGAFAAKQTTQTIPIVTLPLGDPVGVGLVSNIARPEGNITGSTSMTSELAAKRLELLKDAAPSMSRVLVLSYLIDPIAPLQVKTRDAGEVESAIAAFVRSSHEGLIVTGSPSALRHRDLIVSLAARHKLPAVYSARYFVTGGGAALDFLCRVSEPMSPSGDI